MPNPHKRKMRKLMARKKKEDAASPAPRPAPLKKKAVKKEKKGLLETAADALRGGKEK